MSHAPGPLVAALPPRPFDLLGVGECSLESVLRVAALPPPGGKAIVEDWCERPGGQVATAVLTAVGIAG